MTGTIDRVEVITSVQRRRRWSAEEKAAIVQENLPFYGLLRALRLFPRLEQVPSFAALPYVIMLALLTVTAVQVIQLARNGNLVSAFGKMPEQDAMCCESMS